MLQRKIEYVDFLGNKREETFTFHFTEAELTEMELTTDGGLYKHIEKITETLDGPELIRLWKGFILKAYGEISPDGRHFNKGNEFANRFERSAAYNVLFMELVQDSKAGSNFINAVMPLELVEKARKKAEAQKKLILEEVNDVAKQLS